MNMVRWLAASIVALTMLFVSADGSAADLLVTRHFTGLWDQVDQESQGISLQVIEQMDDSKVAVAYWFTYGKDRKSAWYLGIGVLVEDRMEFELYSSSDVGFMQAAKPGDDSVIGIGTMTISFDSCYSGSVTYETRHEEVGSGFFKIKRSAEIMNTRCSGGISDDMGDFVMYGEQQIELNPARGRVNGSGHARYADFPGSSEFEIEVRGIADGNYHLFVGMIDRGEFTVFNGFGELEFHSPMETGKKLLTFDPREMLIEIHDASGVIFSSFDRMFDRDDHDQMGYDEDHDYGCDSGMGNGSGQGMGQGMDDCVEEGEVIEIHASLQNKGFVPAASGEAEWEKSSDRVEFSVEIEDVPVGSYALIVGGTEVGIIKAAEMHGKAVGMIGFRDPALFGKQRLDFDPRGQIIQVRSQDDIILEIDFPAE